MKETPQDAQIRISKALDRLHQSYLVMVVSLLWVVSVCFYFPPYPLLFKGLLMGLGITITLTLVFKARIKNWIESDHLLMALVGTITGGFYMFLMPSAIELRSKGLTTGQMFLWLLQFFCIATTTALTLGYLGRSAIRWFLDLPPKGTVPPALPANGQQLNP